MPIRGYFERYGQARYLFARSKFQPEYQWLGKNRSEVWLLTLWIRLITLFSVGQDVSNVKKMNSAFAHAVKYNKPLDEWDVSAVTDMSGMFYGAHDFDQELNDWVSICGRYRCCCSRRRRNLWSNLFVDLTGRNKCQTNDPHVPRLRKVQLPSR